MHYKPTGVLLFFKRLCGTQPPPNASPSPSQSWHWLWLGGGVLLKRSSQKATPFQLETKSSQANKTWTFAATDRAGTAIPAKLTFIVTTVEKTNQIYVKNKPIRTTADKRFLVVSLELKNDTDKRVYFYSSDFVRLAAADGKKFEADFKNPRFEVAPFSTKKDKLAFLVDADQKSFDLQIGEVAGTRESLPIQF